MPKRRYPGKLCRAVARKICKGKCPRKPCKSAQKHAEAISRLAPHAIADQLVQKWEDTAERAKLQRTLDGKVEQTESHELPSRLQLVLLLRKAADVIAAANADTEIVGPDTCKIMSALQRWSAVVTSRHHEANPVDLVQDLSSSLEGCPPAMDPKGLSGDLADAEVDLEVLPEFLEQKVLSAAKLLSSHLDPKHLRRDLLKAVDRNDFRSASTLSSELQKLCSISGSADALFDAGAEDSTDASVVFPVPARPANSSQDEMSIEHRRCAVELERCQAREEILAKEVAELRDQLKTDLERPQVGRAAIITRDVVDKKESYLGWLCTIVGRRKDGAQDWVVRLMWKHPLGDIVQMPSDCFLVHPALEKLRSRLRELPDRQIRGKEEILALQEKFLHDILPKSFSFSAPRSSSSEASGPARAEAADPSSRSSTDAGRRTVPRGDRRREGWTQEEEERLTRGFRFYGPQWAVIRKKCDLMHRSGPQCKDKWRNLSA